METPKEENVTEETFTSSPLKSKSLKITPPRRQRQSGGWIYTTTTISPPISHARNVNKSNNDALKTSSSQNWESERMKEIADVYTAPVKLVTPVKLPEPSRRPSVKHPNQSRRPDHECALSKKPSEPLLAAVNKLLSFDLLDGLSTTDKKAKTTTLEPNSARDAIDSLGAATSETLTATNLEDEQLRDFTDDEYSEQDLTSAVVPRAAGIYSDSKVPGSVDSCQLWQQIIAADKEPAESTLAQKREEDVKTSEKEREMNEDCNYVRENALEILSTKKIGTKKDANTTRNNLRKNIMHENALRSSVETQDRVSCASKTTSHSSCKSGVVKNILNRVIQAESCQENSDQKSEASRQDLVWNIIQSLSSISGTTPDQALSALVNETIKSLTQIQTSNSSEVIMDLLRNMLTRDGAAVHESTSSEFGLSEVMDEIVSQQKQLRQTKSETPKDAPGIIWSNDTLVSKSLPALMETQNTRAKHLDMESQQDTAEEKSSQLERKTAENKDEIMHCEKHSNVCSKCYITGIVNELKATLDVGQKNNALEVLPSQRLSQMSLACEQKLSQTLTSVVECQKNRSTRTNTSEKRTQNILGDVSDIKVAAENVVCILTGFIQKLVRDCSELEQTPNETSVKQVSSQILSDVVNKTSTEKILRAAFSDKAISVKSNSDTRTPCHLVASQSSDVLGPVVYEAIHGRCQSDSRCYESIRDEISTQEAKNQKKAGKSSKDHPRENCECAKFGSNRERAEPEALEILKPQTPEVLKTQTPEIIKPRRRPRRLHSTGDGDSARARKLREEIVAETKTPRPCARKVVKVSENKKSETSLKYVVSADSLHSELFETNSLSSFGDERTENKEDGDHSDIVDISSVILEPVVEIEPRRENSESENLEKLVGIVRDVMKHYYGPKEASAARKNAPSEDVVVQEIITKYLEIDNTESMQEDEGTSNEIGVQTSSRSLMSSSSTSTDRTVKSETDSYKAQLKPVVSEIVEQLLKQQAEEFAEDGLVIKAEPPKTIMEISTQTELQLHVASVQEIEETSSEVVYGDKTIRFDCRLPTIRMVKPQPLNRIATSNFLSMCMHAAEQVVEIPVITVSKLKPDTFRPRTAFRSTARPSTEFICPYQVRWQSVVVRVAESHVVKGYYTAFNPKEYSSITRTVKYRITRVEEVQNPFMEGVLVCPEPEIHTAEEVMFRASNIAKATQIDFNEELLKKVRPSMNEGSTQTCQTCLNSVEKGTEITQKDISQLINLQMKDCNAATVKKPKGFSRDGLKSECPKKPDQGIPLKVEPPNTSLDSCTELFIDQVLTDVQKTLSDTHVCTSDVAKKLDDIEDIFQEVIQGLEDHNLSQVKDEVSNICGRIRSVVQSKRQAKEDSQTGEKPREAQDQFGLIAAAMAGISLALIGRNSSANSPGRLTVDKIQADHKKANVAATIYDILLEATDSITGLQTKQSAVNIIANTEKLVECLFHQTQANVARKTTDEQESTVKVCCCSEGNFASKDNRFKENPSGSWKEPLSARSTQVLTAVNDMLEKVYADTVGKFRCGTQNHQQISNKRPDNNKIQQMADCIVEKAHCMITSAAQELCAGGDYVTFNLTNSNSNGQKRFLPNSTSSAVALRSDANRDRLLNVIADNLAQEVDGLVRQSMTSLDSKSLSSIDLTSSISEWSKTSSCEANPQVRRFSSLVLSIAQEKHQELMKKLLLSRVVEDMLHSQIDTLIRESCDVFGRRRTNESRGSNLRGNPRLCRQEYDGTDAQLNELVKNLVHETTTKVAEMEKESISVAATRIVDNVLDTVAQQDKNEINPSSLSEVVDDVVQDADKERVSHKDNAKHKWSQGLVGKLPSWMKPKCAEVNNRVYPTGKGNMFHATMSQAQKKHLEDSQKECSKAAQTLIQNVLEHTTEDVSVQSIRKVARNMVSVATQQSMENILPNIFKTDSKSTQKHQSKQSHGKATQATESVNEMCQTGETRGATMPRISNPFKSAQQCQQITSNHSSQSCQTNQRSAPDVGEQLCRTKMLPRLLTPSKERTISGHANQSCQVTDRIVPDKQTQQCKNSQRISSSEPRTSVCASTCTTRRSPENKISADLSSSSTRSRTSPTSQRSVSSYSQKTFHESENKKRKFFANYEKPKSIFASSSSNLGGEDSLESQSFTRFLLEEEGARSARKGILKSDRNKAEDYQKSVSFNPTDVEKTERTQTLATQVLRIETAGLVESSQSEDDDIISVFDDNVKESKQKNRTNNPEGREGKFTGKAAGSFQGLQQAVKKGFKSLRNQTNSAASPQDEINVKQEIPKAEPNESEKPDVSEKMLEEILEKEMRNMKPLAGRGNRTEVLPFMQDESPFSPNRKVWEKSPTTNVPNSNRTHDRPQGLRANTDVTNFSRRDFGEFLQRTNSGRPLPQRQTQGTSGQNGPTQRTERDDDGYTSLEKHLAKYRSSRSSILGKILGEKLDDAADDIPSYTADSSSVSRPTTPRRQVPLTVPSFLTAHRQNIQQPRVAAEQHDSFNTDPTHRSGQIRREEDGTNAGKSRKGPESWAFLQKR